MFPPLSSNRELPVAQGKKNNATFHFRSQNFYHPSQDISSLQYSSTPEVFNPRKYLKKFPNPIVSCSKFSFTFRPVKESFVRVTLIFHIDHNVSARYRQLLVNKTFLRYTLLSTITKRELDRAVCELSFITLRISIILFMTNDTVNSLRHGHGSRYILSVSINYRPRRGEKCETCCHR